MKKKDLTFEEIKESLEQLKYTDIQEVGMIGGEYTAKNYWGNKRNFTLMYEDGNLVLYADKPLVEIMGKHVDFQLFEVDFDFDDKDFKLTVSDYIFKGNSIEELIPKDIPKEVTNIEYKEV